MRLLPIKTWATVVACAGALASSGAAVAAADVAPDCSNPDECVSILRDYQIRPPPRPNEWLSSGVDPEPIQKAIDRLVSFGDPGVVALLPLLNHANHNVRNRAGYALSEFPSIASQHAPDLMRAQLNGNNWLEMPIGKTGTQEALDFLWKDFLANPVMSSNAQTIFGLVLFGERTFPRIQAEMERCRSSADRQRCSGIDDLLDEFPALPAFALGEWEAIARSPSASQDVRDGAVRNLVQRQHPYGLTVLMAELETLTPAIDAHRSRLTANKSGDEILGPDLSIERLIWQIGNYGPEGRNAGPLIARFLEAKGLRETRAAAALAIGKIGYQQAAPALLNLQAELEDDWLLAYNVAEALGRIQGPASGIEVFAGHWFEPVRSNGERVLNFLKTGNFARPNIPGDGEKPDTYLPGQLRYAGDIQRDGATCAARATRTFRQASTTVLSWPGRSVRQPIELELESPTDAQLRTFLAKHPDLELEPRGPITLITSLGAWSVVGTNRGEFGGAVYAIGPKGTGSLLIDANAIAAFKLGDKLLVATGLSHLGIEEGDLWVVSQGASTLQVERRIRLPAEPTNFKIASPSTLIVTASGVDLAIDATGRVTDALKLAVCNS